MAKYTAKVTRVGPATERIDFEAEGHGGRRQSIFRNAGDKEFDFTDGSSYEFDEEGEAHKVKGRKKAE
jgi:hypothetical protein